MTSLEEVLAKEGLGQYTALLLEAGATSVEDLAMVSDEQLKELGVDKVFHRLKLIKLGQLKAGGETSSPRTPAATRTENPPHKPTQQESDGETNEDDSNCDESPEDTTSTRNNNKNNGKPRSRRRRRWNKKKPKDVESTTEDEPMQEDPSSTRNGNSRSERTDAPQSATAAASAAGAEPNTPHLEAMAAGRKHFFASREKRYDHEESEAARAALTAFEHAKRHALNSIERVGALKNIAKSSGAVCFAFFDEDRYDRIPKLLGLISAVDEALKIVHDEPSIKPTEWVEDLGRFLDNSLTTAISNRYEFGRTSNDLIGHLERLTHDLRFGKLTRSCLMVHVLTHHHKRAVVLGEEKEFVKMRSFIQSCESMSIALDQMLETLQAPCSPEFGNKMNEDGKELLSDMVTSSRVAEGRVWLKRGKDCFLKAKSDTADQMMQHTFDALDNLRHCVAGTAQADLAIEAEAQSFFGQVFEKVMKNDEAAERHFKESIRLALACAPRYFGNHPWHRAAQDFVRLLQIKRQQAESAEREKERAPHLKANKKALDALKKAQNKSESELLKHVYSTYKPCGMEKPDAAESTHKNAVKALVHFHPDKVVSEPRVKQVLYEEITVALTGLLNQCHC